MEVKTFNSCPFYKGCNSFFKLLTVSFVIYIIHCCKGNEDICTTHIKKGPVKGEETEVEVLVSPLVSPRSIRELRVFWWTGEGRPGDKVMLYQGRECLFGAQVTASSGLLATGHFEPPSAHPHSSYRAACSNFTAYYTRENGSVVASSCLKTMPTWMSDMRQCIQNMSLSELLVPGTHNSAFYITSDTGYVEGIATKYIYNQDETVLRQLVLGARYLDIRVGYYPHKKFHWWANHDFIPVHPLHLILEQIVNFMNNTQEIVILDFHGFPLGFRSIEIHNSLAEYLRSQLEFFLHKPRDLGNPWDVTLEEIWSSGKRLLLSYNNWNITKTFPFFPRIQQYWGDVDTLPALERYLDKTIPRSLIYTRGVWAAMAELTPGFFGVLSDRYGGLRRMAEEVNFPLSVWLREKPWEPNVVAVDFLRSTALLSAALARNLKRSSPSNCTLPDPPYP